jgi:hypothetical protein
LWWCHVGAIYMRESSAGRCSRLTKNKRETMTTIAWLHEIPYWPRHALKVGLQKKDPWSYSTIAAASQLMWTWIWIHLKIDLISFQSSACMPKMESVWSHGGCWKLVLSCYPNLACANPLCFWSSPSFLSKTRVHVSPLSKYDGQEFKNELNWWLSWRERTRVRGPSGVGDGVGVDVDV